MNRKAGRERRLKEVFESKETVKEEERNVNITFSELLGIFLEDKRTRTRLTTYLNYKTVSERFIEPYFGQTSIRDISPADVRNWQNRIMQLDYAPQYIRKIDSVLTMILNYAVRFYELPSNPALAAGSIGEWKSSAKNFWTAQEYAKFRSVIGNQKVLSGEVKYSEMSPYELDIETTVMACDLLFWTGMRIGELLALTPADVSFEEKTITVSKTFHHIDGRDIIDVPKTKKAYRDIVIHDSLSQRLKNLLDCLGREKDARIFPFTRVKPASMLDRGAKRAGLHRIKLHDLRHSHASLLVEMKVVPLVISERLGHEKVETTLNIYSHLYPDKQLQLSQKLQELDEPILPKT